MSQRTRVPSIDAHRGHWSDFLPRYWGEVASQISVGGDLSEFLAAAVDRIADTRNLRWAWECCRYRGGHAPGPDGLTYTDFSEYDRWPALRVLSELLETNVYTPGAVRRVQIKKSDGSYRQLSLPNIIDRVAQRGVLQIVQPLVDPFFDVLSFGGRPRRGHLQALAMAEWLAIEQQRLVWITADLKDAFGSVPLPRLMDLVGKRLPDARLTDLIRRIVGDQKKGLPQGGPLSAFFMNLYADHFLDQKWRQQFPEVPAIRYIDDELILCRAGDDLPKTCAFLEKVAREAGLHWKVPPLKCVTDLSWGGFASWLGFRIRAGADELQFELPPPETPGGFFERLKDRLLYAHLLPAPTLYVEPLIRAKICQAAPAWEHCDPRQFYSTLRSTVEACGFRELPNYAQVCDEMARASEKWQSIRRAIRTAGPGADINDPSSSASTESGGTDSCYVNVVCDGCLGMEEEAPF